MNVVFTGIIILAIYILITADETRNMIWGGICAALAAIGAIMYNCTY